jgi:hypothetical protein
MDGLKYFAFSGAEPIYVTSIRLSTGQIRTNPDSWTSDELADVGATGPYTKPLHNVDTHELEWDSSALEWKVVEITVDTPSEIDQWIQVRNTRNTLLVDTDQLMSEDYPFATGQKDALLAYRKALRDVGSQADPYNITWPTPPTCITTHFNLG